VLSDKYRPINAAAADDDDTHIHTYTHTNIRIRLLKICQPQLKTCKAFSIEKNSD